MIEESLTRDRKDALSKIKDHVLTILLRKDALKLCHRDELRKTSSEASLNSTFSNDSIISACSERSHIVKSNPFGSPMLPRLIRRFSPRHVKVQRIRSIDRNHSFTLKPALRRETSFGGSNSDAESDSATSSPQLGKRVTFSKYALLLAAAADNSVDELRALLDKDPSYINKPSSSGQTPLHKAALNGHEDCVKLLIERGADVNFADKQGRTPMFLAWEKEHKECFKLMLLASKESLSKESKNISL
ncbi:cortactin-binding protein 2 [Exaiptasia diaphana]|uniref:Uncharacterized protein n=1 Tax=Exaiptasia diaphana TaxID=2652724 RepID=A0A913XMP1_EXADI|nr:cortactin-binding protein 2 [Exaiptasia diaphana]